MTGLHHRQPIRIPGAIPAMPKRGHATVATERLNEPPLIAIAPSPYALRSTTVKNGTLRFAPITNMRLE